MDRWAGRVALVTGASSGIGEGLVRELAKQGMKVVACARNLEKLQAMKAELASASGTVILVKCDLRKESDVTSMFEVIEECGGADVCVNSAGLNYFNTLLNSTNDQLREILEVNVLSLSIVTRDVVKSMMKRKVDDGHIFHISRYEKVYLPLHKVADTPFYIQGDDSGSRQVSKKISLKVIKSMSGHRLTCAEEHFYAATKHAVKCMTEGMRRELRTANTNIRITSISPGCVDTPFMERALADRPEEVPKYLPTYQQIKESDIVDLVLYALKSPPHVELHDVLLRPTQQAS